MIAYKLKLIIKYLFWCLGYELTSTKRFSTELTDEQVLLDLIQRLSPIATDRELIRIGPLGDGGYLIPDDLEGVVACFSPGVDKISGFELECANRGMMVFMADNSVAAPAENHCLFNFTNKFVGAFNSSNFITLDDWVSQSLSNSNSEILMQIDIENFEYEAILSMSGETIRRSRIIVVEFHSLDQLWNRPFFNIASRVFEKILSTHSCVHLHPNNCCDVQRRNKIEIPPMAEFTFLRNDRISSRGSYQEFPHPLDCDSTNRPHIALPLCWRGAQRD
jgi:hypothetical protein